MKILYFGDANAEHLWRWAKHYAELNNEVHVITWNEKILPNYSPAIVHYIKKTRYRNNITDRVVNFASMQRRIKNTIKEINPDIIHSHDAGSYAWIATLMRSRPRIITPWGSDILISVKKNIITKWLTKYALLGADLIQAEGEDTRDALLRLGACKEIIRILPIGVDINKFKPANMKASCYTEKMGMNKPIIISTRTLNPIHDVDTIIMAATKILKVNPNVRFIIVGGGSEYQRLKDLTRTLGVSDSIEFTGHVSEEKMVECLNSACIYLSSSLSDSGTPASTAEAMSCGLPIISTDVGNIRNRINQSNGGFVVKCKDYNSIAEKAIYLLNNEEQRAQKGFNNRLYVEENINAKLIFLEMERIYISLVNKYRNRQ